MSITEVQARRIARTLAQALTEEPDFVERLKAAHATGRAHEFSEVFQRFSEGTDYTKASAAEERAAQRESVKEAVWLWMARVYERCPRQELGETMELKIIADQSGYACGPNRDDEFEAFSFRIETKITEGEF